MSDKKKNKQEMKIYFKHCTNSNTAACRRTMPSGSQSMEKFSFFLFLCKYCRKSSLKIYYDMIMPAQYTESERTLGINMI